MKKETIIRLNESQMQNVIKNTIKEVKKNTINENWFVDMSLQMGDFMYTHFPNLFKELLSFHTQWGNEGNFDFSDPEILKRAKEAVGVMLSVPASIATFFGGTSAAIQVMNKYGDKIDTAKQAFFKRFAKT